MRKPASMKALEELGRVRLSEHFFMREMLYSEIANFHGIPNIPDDPDLAIAAGMRLCEELLEPLHATFGHVSIRSAFRCVEVNTYGAERQDKGYNCGKTAWNHSRHVWDRRDAEGFMGATACIVIPWFVPRYEAGTPWQAMAWWAHDHLPYSDMMFFAVKGKNCAFNLRWHENPARRIEAYSPHKVLLTKRGMANHEATTARNIPGSRSSSASDGVVVPFPNRGAGASSDRVGSARTAAQGGVNAASLPPNRQLAADRTAFGTGHSGSRSAGKPA